MNNLFDPVELAFLADWFGVQRPDAATKIDLTEWMDREVEGFICPRSGGYSDQYGPVENAVARLCLNSIQGQLPQWCAIQPDRTQILGRHYDKPIQRPIQWTPNLLLEINWANRGPGYSWPEAWHVTVLPVFDRCVVTASVDSTDAWGMTDVALGHFAPAANTTDASLAIIEKYWRSDHGYRDDPFECVLEPGMINTRTVWKLARAVWPQEQVES